MSVSLRAGPLHVGQVVFTQSVILESGDSPSSVGSYDSTSGSLNGSSLSGSGTHPHFSQCTSGIGSPQYLCLENTQSLNLKLTFLVPSPEFSIYSDIFSFASFTLIPSIIGELTIVPFSISVNASSSTFPPATTSTIGSPKTLANSWSLAS